MHSKSDNFIGSMKEKWRGNDCNESLIEITYSEGDLLELVKRLEEMWWNDDEKKYQKIITLKAKWILKICHVQLVDLNEIWLYAMTARILEFNKLLYEYLSVFRNRIAQSCV